MTRIERAAIFSAAWLIPSVAWANVIWPALLIQPRLLTIPVVVAGLSLETIVARRAFGYARGKAFLVAAVVNAASAALGVILLPVVGLTWEFSGGNVLSQLFHARTFSPANMAVNFLLAVGVATAVEVLCLRAAFKIPLSKRTWGLWLAANTASVAMAFTSFLTNPLNSDDLYDPWLYWSEGAHGAASGMG